MPKGYSHLTQDLRCQIYTLKSTGLSNRAVSKRLHIHHSTVSRELQRNCGNHGYWFNQAQKISDKRRSKISRTPKKMTSEVVEKIMFFIQQDWSPEQISGRLKLSKIFISHETIYKLIWRDKKDGGRLYKYLRHSGKLYNKRSSGKAGRGCIPNRVDIKERPSIVEEKSRIGDWEGDTIIGAKHVGAILSIVDRHSKYTVLENLLQKTAENVCQAIVRRMQNLPLFSMTFDNGKEFSMHESIAQALNTNCYFATPYHSWERGLNEHTNGLVRQYLPKSSSFQDLTEENLHWIENRLNNRPRKVLNYKTPSEVFFSIDSSQGVALRG